MRTKDITMRSLIQNYQFADFKDEFITLWKFNAPNEDVSGWKHYETLYKHLSEFEHTPSEYSIRVGDRWEGCIPMVDMNCAVYNKEAELQGPLATHSISEAFDMPITIDEDVQMTEKELIAGLVWEISYCKREEVANWIQKASSEFL